MRTVITEKFTESDKNFISIFITTNFSCFLFEKKVEMFKRNKFVIISDGRLSKYFSCYFFPYKNKTEEKIGHTNIEIILNYCKRKKLI